ncbi:hypothetical protein CALCODRAFT_360872 [Calocera cornea HHB12733]|uniref:Uncharacterized protein n=1 Tax=Calocera cornea HHB12733 TaxID=1353952 RepID=A0A165EMT8_9BASI|nr:hypothetical protein CALCODRAFT_360872 [Calocera cornea HHB12733]
MVLGAVCRFGIRARNHAQLSARTNNTECGPATRDDLPGFSMWNYLDTELAHPRRPAVAGQTELEWRPVGPNRIAARRVPVSDLHMGENTGVGRGRQEANSGMAGRRDVREGVVRATVEVDQPPGYLEARGDTLLSTTWVRAGPAPTQHGLEALPPPYENVPPGEGMGLQFGVEREGTGEEESELSSTATAGHSS